MRFKTLAIAIAAVVIALLAYWPAIDGAAIWDDQAWLWNSSTTTGNFAGCWTAKDSSDYWPVTASAFWVQYRLWDRSTRGYHVVNILLHAASALGLWLVLKKLAIPGAFVAAAIFLVHPVAVPSVAWITELKNVLSMFLMMVTLLAWLRFDEAQHKQFDDKRKAIWYGLAIVCFALTLLAKTSTVMLPVVLLGIAWWRRNRITARDILWTAPMFLLSAGMGALTIWFQHARSMGPTAQAGVPEQFTARLAIAGKAFGFYMCKTLWPFELNMVYERWDPGSVSVLYTLAAVAIILAGFVLVLRGRKWPRPLLMGFGYSLIMLLPVLGLIGMSFMKFSFVADHLQYVALPGLIALAVGLGAQILRKAPRIIPAIIALCLVGGLAILTHQRAKLFANPIVLWRDTIARNPSAWVGHSNLGKYWQDYSEQLLGMSRSAQTVAGFNESLRHFTNAINANPNWPISWKNRGGVYWYLGMITQKRGADGTANYDKAISDLDEAIRLKDDYADAYNTRGAAHYQKNQYRQAIMDLQKTLELDPDHTEAKKNLGVIKGRLIERMRLRAAGRAATQPATQNSDQ